MSKYQGIKAIDRASVHRITSGQVVIDLQTAVKELLENSIDAGARNVEVRFKQYGLKSIEVVDDGSGISEEDYDSIALKHHTSKLETFTDLASVVSFGFRGEALSSLCALSEEVTVCTATASMSPMGVSLIMDSSGRIKRRSAVARQPGTTVTLTNLFSSLPVRRKEFERNVKREFGKALTLLSAYALGPCCAGSGVRLSVSNQPDKGPKTISLKTQGTPSSRASVTALWGPKSLDNIIDMDLSFEVERDKATLKRLQSQDSEPISVRVMGLISKFSVSCGRAGTDRQFFYVNGRPCNLNKIQKAFNEVYRSFNATQAPFILADFTLPTECYDVNVSPDKRTILLHNESNLILALKAALETHFAPSRSTYDLGGGTQKAHAQTTLSLTQRSSITRTSRQRSEEAPMQPTLAAIPIQRRPSYISSPPPSPPEPSFNVIRSSVTSSPTPSITHPSKSDTSMDLDEPPEDDEPVVLDPSQTSWGRQLSVASRSQTTTPAPEPEQQPPGPEDEEDAEPPKKKRKSELGLPIVDNRRNEQDYEDEQENAHVHRPAVPTRQEKSPTAQLLGTKGTRSPTRTITATTYRPKVVGSLSSNLRQQLLSFARPGSQLPAKPTSEEEDDGDLQTSDEEEEHAGKDKESSTSPTKIGEPEEDEEVDQLEDDPPTNHDADIAGLTPTKLSRTVSNTSDRPSSPVQRTQDHGRDDGIEEGEGPVDLTAGKDDESEDPSSVLSQALASSSSANPSTLSRADKSRVVRPEVIRSDRSSGGDISLKVDVDKIRLARADGRKRQGVASRSQSGEDLKTDPVPRDAGIGNVENDEKAVSALARVIEKDDFATMDIVGQFNLGFIIIRRRKLVAGAEETDEEATAMDDLFIVDQHAADEKYNFETLQATTRIQSQKLFKPQPLEVTAADEMLALENLEVLRKNGFEIDVDDDDCVAVGQGSRLKLTAQPVSKSTVFNMKDLEELIHLMRDRPSGQMVRCSKARAMFASRACRKSVMVGMPLTQAQMTTVVHHMGTMDQPWNCPHGRPTMRHLSDIRTFGARGKQGPDWSSFA